jgi:hypothetical protein
LFRQNTKNYNTLTQKSFIKLTKISGKNLFQIQDPGSKRHHIPDPRFGSATLIKLTLFLQNGLLVFL